MCICGARKGNSRSKRGHTILGFCGSHYANGSRRCAPYADKATHNLLQTVLPVLFFSLQRKESHEQHTPTTFLFTPGVFLLYAFFPSQKLGWSVASLRCFGREAPTGSAHRSKKKKSASKRPVFLLLLSRYRVDF
jgi:hypothetical protein